VSTVTRNLWRALPLVLTLAILSAASAGAASNIPCWKQLLNEWYSGKITTIYKHVCYVQAISHLPVDVQVYSSARQDIEAAEVNATRDKPAPPEKTKPPAAGGVSTGTTTTNDSNPPKKKKGLIGILDDLTPGNPQAFPLPLLVLGALAILLVIAGGVGMIWQRTHPGDSDPPQT
jgi:cell division septation protein DedD